MKSIKYNKTVIFVTSPFTIHYTGTIFNAHVYVSKVFPTLDNFSLPT